VLDLQPSLRTPGRSRRTHAPGSLPGLRTGHKAHGHHRGQGGANDESPRFDANDQVGLEPFQDLGRAGRNSPHPSPADRASAAFQITGKEDAGLGKIGNLPLTNLSPAVAARRIVLAGLRAELEWWTRGAAAGAQRARRAVDRSRAAASASDDAWHIPPAEVSPVPPRGEYWYGGAQEFSPPHHATGCQHGAHCGGSALISEAHTGEADGGRYAERRDVMQTCTAMRQGETPAELVARKPPVLQGGSRRVSTARRLGSRSHECRWVLQDQEFI